MAMGAADVVPGVSGGTIALITGIYEELIGSLSAFDAAAVKLLFQGRIKDLWTHVNGTFLAVLFGGIFTSIISLAALFSYLLEHYEQWVWSFFFGLVLASAVLVARTVREWTYKAALALVVGTALAYWITTLPAVAGAETPWYLMASGALAICAMILPGISGSFILLLLGSYSIILAAVAERNLLVVAYVGIGAVVGLISFTKLLKWVFAHYHNITIAVLSGFLLGSLNKLWPWKEPIETFTKHAGTPKEEVVVVVSKNLMPGEDWPLSLVFALLGMLIVLGMEYAGRARTQVKNTDIL